MNSETKTGMDAQRWYIFNGAMSPADPTGFFTRAPFRQESETSRAAAKAMDATGKHGTIKRAVYDLIRSSPGGMTDEEMALLVMQTIRCRFTSVVAARNSLCKGEYKTWKGLRVCISPPLVEDSNMRRLSPTSGMRVVVWRVT